MSDFLNGIEIVEITDGVRPIRAANTSVIGLIGTAPDADVDAFPLNTPVLVAGSRTAAAGLGLTGTLPTGLVDIFNQIAALVIVVRVEEAGQGNETLANIIGGIDGDTGEYTGMQAFLVAQAETGFKPKILASADTVNNAGVLAAMVPIANRLRAVVVGGPNRATLAEAIDFRASFGTDRLYLFNGQIVGFDQAEERNTSRLSSAAIAGAIARRDNERGFWWSPSNQVIDGIVGVRPLIEHSITDQTAESQLFNANDVNVIVRDDGFRIWGNRTTSDDPLWAFLSVRRTADQIYESIEESLRWAMARPISAQLLNDVVDSVNAYLRRLVSLGALLGGRATINPELNSPESLKAGRLFIDFDIEPPAPLERLTFRAHRNNGYYTELIQQVAA